MILNAISRLLHFKSATTQCMETSLKVSKQRQKHAEEDLEESSNRLVSAFRGSMESSKQVSGASKSLSDAAHAVVERLKEPKG